MRPHSFLSGGSVSSFDDPAIVDLLLSSTSSTDSSVLGRVRRRGQRLVLHSETTTPTDGGQLRRRGRLSRLYRNTVRSEVAEVGNIHNYAAPDIKLMGYRRIMDDTFELVKEDGEQMKKNGCMEQDHRSLNGLKDQEEKDVVESQSASFDNPT